MRRSVLVILILLVTLFPKAGRTQSFRLFSRDKEPKTWEDMAVKLSTGSTSDSLKVLSIYKWITENISYDYSAYMSGQPIRYQSPELVYARRKTTCTGYSNLMVSMLEIVGIPAMEVEGFTHDFTLGLDSTKLSADHAWVAFKADGNWHVADPTWDAGVTGIYADFNSTEEKKSFWKRIKSFRLKHLRKKYRNSKTVKKTKVTYRYGFIHNPGLDYIFQDPDLFLKSHLPNTAHFQMRGTPVSVEQFCDSVHSIGEYIYHDGHRKMNFNTLNDLYYGLEKPDRYLWIADSSLNYHQLNHGDKAINAHNYLAYYYSDRTKQPAMLEKFISISDTVILHAAIATRINKSELLKKKADFGSSFQREKQENSIQLTQLNFTKSHISRNPEILRKAKERITQKEIPYLMRVRDRGNSASRVYEYHSPPISTRTDIDSMINRIVVLSDSVRKLQDEELKIGVAYREKFTALTDSVLLKQQKQFEAMYQGEYLNEWEVQHNDRELSRATKILNDFVRDSLNTILGNRKSYKYLVILDKEIKKQQVLLADWQKKDSCLNIDQWKAFTGTILRDAADHEFDVIENRTNKMEGLQSFYRYELNAHVQMLSKESKSLNDLRNLRQGYLYKMLNNKFNRSMLVYKAISTNAKNWKKMYRSRLKEIEKNTV